jgi:hypothetical protein
MAVLECGPGCTAIQLMATQVSFICPRCALVVVTDTVRSRVVWQSACLQRISHAGCSNRPRDEPRLERQHVRATPLFSGHLLTMLVRDAGGSFLGCKVTFVYRERVRTLFFLILQSTACATCGNWTPPPQLSLGT